MLAVFKILFKLFVSQFYKLNGGFFLFWFIFFFGVVSPGMLGVYHLALIQAEIESFVMLIGVMIGWFLYNEKCLECFKTIMLKYKNSFLHVLQAVDSKKIILIFGICHILVFLPVSIYALIVAGVAISQAKFLVAVLVLFFLIVITITSTFRIRSVLSSRIPSRSYSLFSRFQRKSRLINYNFFLVRYILTERKINILILKIFSSIFFYLFFIKHISEFSKPWFVMALLLISYAHSVLIFHTHKFIEEKLSFMRNLPISLFKRIAMFVIPICLVFIPELLFMLINGLSVLSIEDVVTSYCILVTQLMLYTSILYIKNVQLKEYLKYIFAIFLLSTFLYNALDHLWLILLQFGLCYALFKIQYFKYEHIVYTN